MEKVKNSKFSEKIKKFEISKIFRKIMKKKIKITEGKISEIVKWAELAPGVAMKKSSDQRINWDATESLSKRNKTEVSVNNKELVPSILKIQKK